MNAIKNSLNGRWDLQGVEDSVVTYERMLSMIHAREPFSFSRWGDGEFNAILGVEGRNCDGHQYFPEMGQRLRQVLLSRAMVDVTDSHSDGVVEIMLRSDLFKDPPRTHWKNYIMGLQPLSLTHSRSQQVKDLIEPLGIPWVNADTLHNASIDEYLGRFFDALKTRRVLLVGPEHLKFFKAAQIVVPRWDCWMAYETIKNTLEEFLKTQKEPWVVLLCASMMSEVLIDDFRNWKHTFIDLGSALDFYAGVKSRSYHHKMKPLE